MVAGECDCAAHFVGLVGAIYSHLIKLHADATH